MYHYKNSLEGKALPGSNTGKLICKFGYGSITLQMTGGIKPL